MYIPTTKIEAEKLGWNEFDIILVSGDSYIDSPFMGAAVIGKVLISKGYKVGIIAQPDIENDKDIKRLGEPKLFWGVTGGSVDSMVANYTASKKRRKQDDFTPGELNNRRPDRAVIKYSNLIRRYFKSTCPIVIGGIEASLRRVVHYDFWSNKLRRSILFDSKADYLIYGMGEKSVIELADKLKKNKFPDNVRGVCYLSNKPNYKYLELPNYESCVADKNKFIEMFELFYHNNDPVTAKGLYQQTGERYYIQNPPAEHPSQAEIDSYYKIDYERDLHPYYAKKGRVRALDTIRFSILTHRGCYGECNFCAIAVHQGKTIVSRSEESIINEAKSFGKHKKFKGVISDVGGPTANMYGFECDKKILKGVCEHKACVFPDTCGALKPTHKPQIDLLRKIQNLNGVRRVFVASGIRYDLITDDKIYGKQYLNEVVSKHTSGQMKIAPEHSNDKVLDLMRKPGKKYLNQFKEMFYKISAEAGKEQYLTYYFIAAHPGCSENEMKDLKTFASEKLSISPEQVQVFTPTPSTYSTLMYYTETNPFTGKKLFVEKDMGKKEKQKSIIVEKPKPGNKFKGRRKKYK